MRITVDIDESLLKELLELMGEKKRSPAIARALEDYVKRRKARAFGKLLREGAFDYPQTNDAIESQDI